MKPKHLAYVLLLLAATAAQAVLKPGDAAPEFTARVPIMAEDFSETYTNSDVNPVRGGLNITVNSLSQRKPHGVYPPLGLPDLKLNSMNLPQVFHNHNSVPAATLYTKLPGVTLKSRL